MKISVLDFGIVSKGTNAISYIENMIEEVRLLDKLSFSRFWVTEHHEGAYAWQTPEVVITLLSAYTERIRVGVAGVLLPIHSTLRVAECYKLLNNLFNDRIDMGIAKSGPGPELIPYFINANDNAARVENHYQRVEEIFDIYRPDFKITISPKGGNLPQIWMLGTSLNCSSFVMQHQVPVCFSVFHPMAKGIDERELDSFRNAYHKQHGVFPKVSLAMSVLAASDQRKLRRMEKQFEEVNGKEFRLNVKGDFDFVAEELEKYKKKYHLEEIVIINCVERKKDRFAFYEHLSSLIN